MLKADYEQELELQRAAHKRELSRTRDEMMQLLSSVESGRMPGNEELMGRKYMKEVEHIKVSMISKHVPFVRIMKSS